METLVQSIVSGLLTGSLYAMIGVGLTVIFGVMRIINMAHGDMVMFGMYGAFLSITFLKIDPFLSILIWIPLAFFVGVLIYRFLLKNIVPAGELNTLLYTAVLSLFIANLVLLVTTLVKPPKGTTHVVLDTPAGLHGKKLDEVMKIADKVLVPLQPSIFDIYATRAFVTELLARRKHDKVPVAVVGNRVRDGSISAGQLDTFLDTLGVPLLGHLRDTQNYIQLAAHGLTLFDVAPSRVEKDLEQWQGLCRWLDH